MENNTTNEIEQELKERMDKFLKEYSELVDKYKVDFATYPVYMPDGQGGFKTIIQSTPVDVSKQPTKSPFVAQE